MKKMTLSYAGTMIAAGFMAVSASASAKTQPSSDFFALGVGSAPTFVGSDNYRTIPIFFGHVSIAGMSADILGGGVHLNVIQPSSDWSAGPVLNYLPKRKSRHGNDRLRQLNNVKAAFEVGGFVARDFGGTSTGEGVLRLKLTGVHDVNNAYDGAKITAEASYAALRSRPLSVDVSVSTTWADEHYQQTYLGVSPEEAARSGLAEYHPSSSFRNVTVGITLSHQLTPEWAL